MPVVLYFLPNTRKKTCDTTDFMSVVVQCRAGSFGFSRSKLILHRHEVGGINGGLPDVLQAKVKVPPA
jgi:hypothetical protein